MADTSTEDVDGRHRFWLGHAPKSETPKGEGISLSQRSTNTQLHPYEILIDNEVAKEGSLLEDLDPAINPPAEINDPTDFKPEDWVDEDE
eukprot:9179791-Pyramimonas_sp.AAC.1